MKEPILSTLSQDYYELNPPNESGSGYASVDTNDFSCIQGKNILYRKYNYCFFSMFSTFVFFLPPGAYNIENNHSVLESRIGIDNERKHKSNPSSKNDADPIILNHSPDFGLSNVTTASKLSFVSAMSKVSPAVSKKIMLITNTLMTFATEETRRFDTVHSIDDIADDKYAQLESSE